MKSAVNASIAEGKGTAVFGVCGEDAYTKIWFWKGEGK
jgi:hypothetical protein